MTSKEALEYIRKHPTWQYAAIHGMNKVDQKLVDCFEQTEKYLDILDKLKKVLSKVAYTPEVVYGKEDENGFIPVNCEYKVTCGEEFDIALFKNLIDQLGFELKEKTKN